MELIYKKRNFKIYVPVYGMQKSVWIARPSFPFNASFLFRYYTLYLFFLFSFFFAVVVNETIYYNLKKKKKLATGYNNDKSFPFMYGL